MMWSFCFTCLWPHLGSSGADRRRKLLGLARLCLDLARRLFSSLDQIVEKIGKLAYALDAHPARGVGEEPLLFIVIVVEVIAPGLANCYAPFASHPGVSDVAAPVASVQWVFVGGNLVPSRDTQV